MKIEMYHATDLANFDSIFEKGLLKGIDECVYCCDTQKDAAKFAYVHCVKHILVVGFEIDTDELVESFDHDQQFFACRAWCITHNIAPEALKSFTLFNIDQ